MEWSTGWLLKWLAGWLMEWLAEWLMEWLTNGVVDGVVDWVVDGVVEYFQFFLSHFISHLTPLHVSFQSLIGLCVLHSIAISSILGDWGAKSWPRCLLVVDTQSSSRCHALLTWCLLVSTHHNFEFIWSKGGAKSANFDYKVIDLFWQLISERLTLRVNSMELAA